MQNKTPRNPKPPVNSLKDVFLNAWNNTFLTNFKFNKDNKFNFLTVFKDWPDTGRLGHKALHFSKCFFKSIVQLPFFLIAETMSYLSNKVMSLNTKNSFLLFNFFSLLILPFVIVELISKVIGTALNIITSPISCFKEAWKINKLLGLASIIISLAIYAGIAYVAYPFLVSAAFLKIVGILSGIVTTGGFVAELIYSSFKASKRPDEPKNDLKSELDSTVLINKTIPSLKSEQSHAQSHAQLTIISSDGSRHNSSTHRGLNNGLSSNSEVPVEKDLPRNENSKLGLRK